MDWNTRDLLAATSLSISLILNLLSYSSCTNIINESEQNETILKLYTTLSPLSLPFIVWFVCMYFCECTY